MTNLQNKPIVIGNPVEIDKACNDIRLALSQLTWISHPYFIAKKFLKYDSETKKQYIYPETYAPDISDSEDLKKRPYHRLTPDNDYSGMFFFIIGDGNFQDEGNDKDFITYEVGVIFSVNLELINETKLNQGIYTRELMAQARNVIKKARPSFIFNMKMKSETDDLQRVYREFKLDDLEQYNRAPMQCFRLDLEITIEEECI